MVNLSKKSLVAIILLCVGIAVLTVLLSVNFMGWGVALAGVGGPFATGLAKVIDAVPLWMIQGWPQRITIIAVGLAVLFAFSYVIERKEVFATLLGTKSGNAGDGSYQSKPDQNIIPLSDQQSKPS